MIKCTPLFACAGPVPFLVCWSEASWGTFHWSSQLCNVWTTLSASYWAIGAGRHLVTKRSVLRACMHGNSIWCTVDELKHATWYIEHSVCMHIYVVQDRLRYPYSVAAWAIYNTSKFYDHMCTLVGQLFSVWYSPTSLLWEKLYMQLFLLRSCELINYYKHEQQRLYVVKINCYWGYMRVNVDNLSLCLSHTYREKLAILRNCSDFRLFPPRKQKIQHAFLLHFASIPSSRESCYLKRDLCRWEWIRGYLQSCYPCLPEGDISPWWSCTNYFKPWSIQLTADTSKTCAKLIVVRFYLSCVL